MSLSSLTLESMHSTWQLLERHQHRLNPEKNLWLAPPENHRLMKSSDELIALDRPLNQLRADISKTPEDRFAKVNNCILFNPKAKTRLDWWLSIIATQVEATKVFIVGDNQGGIKSLARRVAPFARVNKIDSARHCTLLELELTGPVPSQSASQYQYDGLSIQAEPGVFSQHRIDAGSQLLLQTLPNLKGSLLEFGCGSGVIASCLLKRHQTATLTALDIDWLAIKSTQKTLQMAGVLERANLLWSDGLAEVGQQTFDAIITNPPFHQGIKTNYQASEAFFSQCHAWLRKGGELWWVANDFLDYHSIVRPHFSRLEQQAHSSGYRVFKARK